MATSMAWSSAVAAKEACVITTTLEGLRGIWPTTFENVGRLCVHQIFADPEVLLVRKLHLHTRKQMYYIMVVLAMMLYAHMYAHGDL